MRYTIKTASWANEDKSSAVINTEEVGHKAISAVDTSEAWAGLLAWQAAGGVIRPLTDGGAYRAEKERQAASATRKAEAEKKLAKLGLTVDDIKAIVE